MQKTPKYQFKKRELTDSPPDITATEDNWDKVEQLISDVTSQSSDSSKAITALQSLLLNKGFLESAKSATDCNLMVETGVYSGYSIPNSPTAGRYYLFLVMKWDSTTLVQVAVGMGGYFDLKIRWKTVGGWQAWYNPSDGGNADTVDGLHGSDLMRHTGNQNLSITNTYPTIALQNTNGNLRTREILDASSWWMEGAVNDVIKSRMRFDLNTGELYLGNNSYPVMSRIEGVKTTANQALDSIINVAKIYQPDETLLETIQGGLDLGSSVPSVQKMCGIFLPKYDGVVRFKMTLSASPNNGTGMLLVTEMGAQQKDTYPNSYYKDILLAKIPVGSTISSNRRVSEFTGFYTGPTEYALIEADIVVTKGVPIYFINNTTIRGVVTLKAYGSVVNL